MLEQYFSHNLNLEELRAFLQDSDATKEERDNIRSEIDYTLGYKHPIAQIRNSEFSSKNIFYLEIDNYGKIPTVTASLRFDREHLLSSIILKDKEILKTFMRSSNPNLNHLRCDFYLTDINKNRKTKHTELIVSGELNIPRLHSSINGAYSGTSHEVLQQIAKELELGFISNIPSTDDFMVWPATNQTYFQFIDYIVKHSWIDDNSFLDWYIDSYYNLVFYEVNKSLKQNEFDTRAYFKDSSVKRDYDNMGENQNSMQWKNILTDLGNMNVSDHGIIQESLKLLNNSGLSKNGYFVDNILVDYEDLEIIRFASEAIANLNDGIPLKGREDDLSYTDERRVKFLGIQNDNMHPNYKYSQIHNYINNLELKKLNIEVDTTDLNLNYIIGNNIFLQITEHRLESGSNEDYYAKTRDNKTIPDLYFSNNYKIHGIKYIYKKGEKFCRYLLTRREWPEIIE